MNRNIKYYVVIGLVILLIMYFPSAKSFGSNAYVGAVIKYKDGSIQQFKPGALSIIGLNIIDVSNGKTIQSITFILEATPKYTESIYMSMYPGGGGESTWYYLQLTGEYSIVVEYDYEGNAETYYYKHAVDFKTSQKQIYSGGTVEYTLVTISADDLESFIKSKGLSNGDIFKLYIVMNSDVTGYLLDDNGNVVGKKVINKNDVLILTIGLKYESPNKLTSLQAKFGRRISYR